MLSLSVDQMLVLDSRQQDRISTVAQRWGVEAFDLFGSALGDAMRPDSDVDVLVEFKPDVRRSLFDLVEMEEDLARVFGRPVDLLTRHGVAQSRNVLRRDAILASARPLYRAHA